MAKQSDNPNPRRDDKNVRWCDPFKCVRSKTFATSLQCDLCGREAKTSSLCLPAAQQDQERLAELGANYDKLYAEHCQILAERDGAVSIATQVGRELERARVVIDTLPKTADGIAVTPGMKVWLLNDNSVIECHSVFTVQFNGAASTNGKGISLPGACYSTREAAEAASKEQK